MLYLLLAVILALQSFLVHIALENKKLKRGQYSDAAIAGIIIVIILSAMVVNRIGTYDIQSLLLWIAGPALYLFLVSVWAYRSVFDEKRWVFKTSRALSIGMLLVAITLVLNRVVFCIMI